MTFGDAMRGIAIVAVLASMLGCLPVEDRALDAECDDKCDELISSPRAGVSMHVGVARPEYFDGAFLQGTTADAESMAQMATEYGFAASMLLEQAATAEAIMAGIEEATQALDDGDVFLLTFAGHGTQVEDLNGDETDSLDEALALFDRLFLDDELRVALRGFSQGVRVVIIVDACNSATLIDCPADDELPVTGPTTLSLSAAQDGEPALDGHHGLFTSALLFALADDGDSLYRGDYRKLRLDVHDFLRDRHTGRLPQHPALHVCGPDAEALVSDVSFRLDRWQSSEIDIHSPDPYHLGMQTEYPVIAPAGAQEIRLRFDRIIMRTGEAVEVYDGDDTLVGRYTGRMWNRLTPVISGDRATIRLISAGEPSNFAFKGFELEEIVYR